MIKTPSVPKSLQVLRASGLATFKQKINIGKVIEGRSIVEQSALLGIARKVINLDRRDHPSISKVVRTRDIQSFEVDLHGKNWLVHQSRHNNIWVMSENHRA